MVSVAGLGIFTPLEIQTHRRTAIRVKDRDADRDNSRIAQRLLRRYLVGLTVVHRQRLAVGLLQIFTEGGKIGFTLRRGRFFVITPQHQRTGVFYLNVRQQFLIDDFAQVVRISLNLRLLVFQAVEGYFLSSAAAVFRCETSAL